MAKPPTKRLKSLELAISIRPNRVWNFFFFDGRLELRSQTILTPPALTQSKSPQNASRRRKNRRRLSIAPVPAICFRLIVDSLLLSWLFGHKLIHFFAMRQFEMHPTDVPSYPWDCILQSLIIHKMCGTYWCMKVLYYL